MKLQSLPRYTFGAAILLTFVAIFAKFSVEAYEQACDANQGGYSYGCSLYGVTLTFARVLEHFVETYDRAIETISTFLVAVFTYTLWRSTDKLGDMSVEQGAAMEKSIRESARAATAIEAIAKHFEISSKAAADSVLTMKERTGQQLRAYLTIGAGFAVFQETAKNLRFAIHPQLLNSGQTPAHKVRYWARAAILPFPTPEDFDFPEPEEKNTGAMIVGPHQQMELNAVVDNLVPEDEIAKIKQGFPNRVHIWGVVTYFDITGEERTTKFCQSVYWFPTKDGEGINCTYSRRHNEAT
jgi:hypothetical protein